ncbi:MAG: DegV family protein, partial [Actinomycetota bacterium]|nr:DegV family protein [Actinomycetota bacterium]
MPVAIVTGSQTCIPRALADSYEIEILPYGLELKNRSYRDGVDITPEEFYRYLPTVDGLAHTSATPPGVFLEAFERLSARAEGILVITIASGMSTIHHNAIIASTTFTGAPVRVLDSRTAAMAQGFVVIEAAKAAQARASLDECYLVAEEASHKVDLYAYISTFDYLKKSGRVTAVKA